MHEPSSTPDPAPRAEIYLWAAFGHESASPTRLSVTTCPRCGALVPESSAVPHEGWHARREDTLPGSGFWPPDDDQRGWGWSSSGPG